MTGTTADKAVRSGAGGAQIPLGQLAAIRYTRGPQSIKSEDTFLVAYVTFDRPHVLNALDEASNRRCNEIWMLS